MVMAGYVRPRAAVRFIQVVSRRNISSAATASSSSAQIASDLKNRRIPLIYDVLSAERSHRLDISLADILPASRPRSFPFGAPESSILPPSHHFLYSEPSSPAEQLLPDGTNPEHFPGPPFHRRMWAGGSIRHSHTNPCRLDNRAVACLETIRDVDVRGVSGREKVFLGIERRLARLTADEVETLRHADSDKNVSEVEDGIRRRLWRDDEEDLGDCGILERRSIVFLRKPSFDDRMAERLAKTKFLKAKRPADLFSHVFTPDRSLLFRYSALTFNAHAIHIDPEYCRQEELHPDSLVHGTLSLTCLVTMLQNALSPSERIDTLEYRNLASLYRNEPVRLCGHKLRNGAYELWAENSEGGIATQATVKTTNSHIA